MTGYSKDDKTWKNNSRVKAFNIYENDKLVANVQLKDTRAVQTFGLKNHRRNKEAMSLKFIITEVYKGDKYDDTAFSEIVFDGEDVHCLAEGTRITMADGSEKNIENIVVGDSLLAYNTGTGEVYADVVVNTHSVKHNDLIKITLFRGWQIITTKDHPFWADGKWKSYSPSNTKQYDRYLDEEIVKYKKKDNLSIYIYLKGLLLLPIERIDPVKETMRTYTLELKSDGCFIANDFVVGQE